jgi:hypothetical protein
MHSVLSCDEGLELAGSKARVGSQSQGSKSPKPHPFPMWYPCLAPQCDLVASRLWCAVMVFGPNRCRGLIRVLLPTHGCKSVDTGHKLRDLHLCRFVEKGRRGALANFPHGEVSTLSSVTPDLRLPSCITVNSRPHSALVPPGLNLAMLTKTNQQELLAYTQLSTPKAEFRIPR